MPPAAIARDARPLRRKTIALLTASAAVAAAAALLTARGAQPRAAAVKVEKPGACESTTTDSGGMRLTVRGQSCQLLRGRSETHVAVEIEAPAMQRNSREAVALALVVDRSGSMLDLPQFNSYPLRDAKAAAVRAIDALEPTDYFSVTSYSNSAELLVPIGPATLAHKAEARAAIERMRADGGTNISDGLIKGASTLSGDCAGQCPRDHVGRIVLISDGDANDGIFDLDGLVALAARTAEDGASITSVGLGLDFNATKMTQIAVAGRGNYYFVEDAASLAGMFERELSSLGETVAVDARLELTAAPGVELVEAYGYRANRNGQMISVPVADLRLGETRKVVVKVRVDAGQTGAMNLVSTRLVWRPVGAHQQRNTDVPSIAVTITEDRAAVAGSKVAAAERHVQEAQLARALDEATDAYEKGDTARATAIFEAQAGVAAESAAMLGDDQLERTVHEVRGKAKTNFAPAPRGDAGRRGSKDNRGMAYDLSR